MLEARFIRENREKVQEMLKNRNNSLDLSEFDRLDAERREILSEVEALKRERNTASAKVAQFKKEGKDASEVIKEMGSTSAKIKELDAKLAEVEEKVNYILMIIPNMYHETTPIRSEEHTSELQSRQYLVCRLLLEKKR